MEDTSRRSWPEEKTGPAERRTMMEGRVARYVFQAVGERSQGWVVRRVAREVGRKGGRVRG